ncbi:uncharacterized protein LOC133735742 [Rosa rugosa]|uniref:uncharacterized protein LOC133735742 n=1 Tax=Rosa rugosa TaxID=74645 RepID=UPI002B4168C2|nr:uncharacterized protein LOC133735742 [Rosa rugosa]
MRLVIGTSPCMAEVHTEFIIVDCFSSYNAIIGRPALNKLKCIIAGYMLLMKFPTPNGTGCVRGSQQLARECYSTTIARSTRRHEILTVGSEAPPPNIFEDPRDEEEKYVRKEPVDPDTSLKVVCLSDEHPERTVRIGAHLNPEVEAELTQFLRDNAAVFAWSYADMPGISPEIITHKLTIKPSFYPIKQKRRAFDEEKYRAIREEVAKLQDIGFIRQVIYPQWISNLVMVKKASGKWRMCVDFKNLNKACPKDSFPLPRIDQLVDATAGHELLSMMDAFSGYNQIKMHPSDQECTTFTTDKGLYCYNVMPFGLKNTGATYQRLMNAMFAEHLGKIIEVYVDDMLVKSVRASGHVANLKVIVTILLAYGMRLNPEKCFFAVTASKFLGYIVSERGIEANPDKVQAILDLADPKYKVHVQCLQGKLTALSRFISRLTDKCASFFKLLKTTHKKVINWNPECQAAFQGLKEYLAAVPLLSVPVQGEILFIYLAVSASAVSCAIVQREGQDELPVFYAGRGMNGAETRYPPLEQLALALIVAARRLRQYFQAHTIHVLTNQPLRQVMQNPEHSGRLSKWAIELSEFDIDYRPRTAMKGQAVADFIAELTERQPEPGVETRPGTEMVTVEEVAPPQSDWNLHVDGSANAKASGAGIILTGPGGLNAEYALKFNFKASNNMAEYEALIAGLLLAIDSGADSVNIFSDSQLVVNQVNDSFQAKDQQLAAYLGYVKTLLKKFKFHNITQIPREKNAKADSLARLATAQPHQSPADTRVEYLDKPSITKTLAEIFNIEVNSSWMDEIIAYKRNGTLPEDKIQARQLKRRATRYNIQNGKLYRQGFTYPNLRCLTPEEGKIVLAEIHGGECGNHSGARSLANRTLRQGYFWPTLGDDARKISRSCHKCQQFADLPHAPAEPLSVIIGPWVHSTWGLDLMGKFQTAKGQFKYIIVAIDYNSKWIEAEPLTAITTAKVIRFLWKNIYCRYGVPHTIITDNGTQFNNKELISFTANLGTKLSFASVAHPQTNGQVEAANKIIKKLLKKKLDSAKGLWAEKLPEVLWAIRTTPTTATGETPFCMMFGTEAVLPIEVTQPTARVEGYCPDTNGDGINLDRDLLEEKRLKAHLRNLQNKRLVSRFYNARVKARNLQLGDWVMKEVIPPPTKLRPTWEGPYNIVEVVSPGTFYLMDKDGVKSAHPWNTEHLRYYYK